MPIEQPRNWGYVMHRNLKLLIGLSTCLLTSCASIDGPGFGDGASLTPGFERFKQKFFKTVRRPELWGPLAAAVVLQVDDMDSRLAKSIHEDKPLFGSTQNARDASDDLRELTKINYLGTAIVAPVGNNENWLGTKSKLLIAELAGVSTTQSITGRLKDSTERERPDDSNYGSFPSGHASKASVQAQFAIINTRHLPLQENTKRLMNIGFNSLSIGTAWSRIEAEKHYPSDVLAGWALGYFIAEMTSVFIEGEAQQSQISAHISPDEWQIVYKLSF